MEDGTHLSHIGWSGLGKFIDYLETMYDMSSASWTLADFLDVDKTLADDVGIITATGKGHLAYILKRKMVTIWDGDTTYRVLKIVQDDQFFEETGNHKVVLERVE